MEIYRQLSTERRQQLTDQVTALDRLYEVLFVPIHERPRAIQVQAKLALGVTVETDIATLPGPAKTELLFAMSALRDAIPQDRIWL